MSKKNFKLKKSGFTLVELLGVVAFLAVIALITIRPINQYIINSKQKLYENQLTMIELAAKNWGTDHLLFLPTNEGDSIFLSLCQLQSGGYLDEKIKNVITGKVFYADTSISITRENGQYIYQVDEGTGTSYICPDLEPAPTLVINGKTTQYVELGSSYTAPHYKAYSINGENITDRVTFSIKKDDKVEDKINPYLLGTYTVTYSIEDEGVVTSLNHTVIVRDTTAPVITLNGSSKNQSATIEAAKTYFAPLAEVTDNSLYDNTPYHVTCGGDSIITENGGACIGISSVTPKIAGNYEVKYVAVDESGNKSTLIYTVKVTPDLVPPTIEFTTEIVLTNPNAVFNKKDGVVLTDNVSDSKDITLEVIGNTNFSSMAPGTYEVTYKATDEAGNVATKKRTIKVRSSAPSLVINNGATQYVELASSYTVPNYVAYSMDGEVITDKVTISSIKKDEKVVNQVDPYLLGTYTVTYSVTDGGKTTTSNHTVIVRDTTPPVITLNGSTNNQSTTIAATRTYSVPVATVTDNSLYSGTPYYVSCGGSSIVFINGSSCVGISSVTPTIPGNYQVRYVATDGSGNQTTLIYTVTVTPDLVPPTIEFTTDIVLTATNPTFNKTDGVVLTDNISDSKNIKLEVIGTVNFDTMDAGTYEVTYKATDEAGNSATKKRTITIQKTEIAGPDTSNYLKKVPVYPSPYAYFLDGPVKRNEIESVTFLDHQNMGSNVKGSWRATAQDNDKIMAWYKDEDGNGLYEVYIGAKGGVVANPYSGDLFYYCTNLKEIDFSNFYTINVTDMSDMFGYSSKLVKLDLTGFDTSKVTNMGGMFQNCTSLISLDLTDFDTSKVIYMSYMFSECSSLKSLNIIGFDTSKVTSMYMMFYGCKSLTSLDLTKFKTSNVTSMSRMFYGCDGLTSLYITGFNTSSVTDMSYMFANCSALTSLDVTGFDTRKVTNMSDMFYNCSSLINLDVTGFDTTNVKNMSYMFNRCSKLTSLNLTGFDTRKVTDMSNMFYYCSSLTSLDVTGFDTTNVTNISGMFGWCSKLTSLDVTGFDTGNVKDMSDMFYYCSSLTSLDVTGFDTSKVTSMRDLFGGCSKLTSLDVTGFDTTNVTNMAYMFGGLGKLTSLDVTSLDTTNVKNMSQMFYGCGGLTSLDITGFNTSNVTNMSSMFFNCSGLISLDLTSFDTTNVTSMTSIFAGCIKLQTIYVNESIKATIQPLTSATLVVV